MLRDYKGAESVDTTDPNTEAARQFAQASHRRVGRVVAGKYELLKTIGVGGMGAVFEARHQLTDRRVAVKLIHTNLAGNRAHVSRFMREARAASEIGHAAIVDVLDAGTTEDGLVYMVLELLQGEDLEDAVRRGHLNTAEVIGVAVDVLDCLASAHDRGVVHRDIKPENVYLATDEHGARSTKVLDFGIAKHLRDDPDTSMTRTGTIVGTPDFMSPEQARGDSVDGRTDLWAVGALLHYALTGEPPFVAENYNKLIIRIVTEEAPSIGQRRPDLPAELVAVIDRAMHREPKDRWPDARSMLEALRAVPLPVSGAVDPAAPAGRSAISRSGVWQVPGATSASATAVAPLSHVALSQATAAPGARLPWLLLGLVVLGLVVFLATSALLGREAVTPTVPRAADAPTVPPGTAPPPAAATAPQLPGAGSHAPVGEPPPPADPPPTPTAVEDPPRREPGGAGPVKARIREVPPAAPPRPPPQKRPGFQTEYE